MIKDDFEMDSALPRAGQIALYGGAFDPIHKAHLAIADCALKALKLTKLIFIPSAQSPLKEHGPMAGDSERIKMLQIAIANDPRLSLSRYEIEKGGVSYTLDTVQHFRQQFEGSSIYWILGADQFEQLDRWRAIEDLVSLVTFIPFSRPGHSLQAPRLPGLNYISIEGPEMEHSSTRVRRLCRERQSITGLVPDAVEAFISRKGLYTHC